MFTYILEQIDRNLTDKKERGELVEIMKLIRQRKLLFVLGLAMAVCLSAFCGTQAQAASNKKQMTSAEFVSYIGKQARKDMKKTGVLASVTTAQAILESGYGKSSLAIQGNNLFGIKAKTSWSSKWNGKTYTKSTKEYINGRWITIKDAFRSYDSWSDSIYDHSQYLINAKNGSKARYPGIAKCKSYKKATKIIKNGGYATAPNYDKVLCELIQRWNLTKYDK